MRAIDAYEVIMVWARVGRALLSALRRVLATIRAYLPRPLGGPDVLRGARGGHTKVRAPRGFAPWGGV